MKLENIYIGLLLVLTVLLNINNLDLPYYWDDFNYVIPAVDYVYRNVPTIFLWEYGVGHPPFFFNLAGLIFKLFGDSVLLGHLIILIFSFLAVLFTYLTGKELFSRKVGIIASLLLLFTPIFVSYSSLFYLEMPLTALIIMSIYFAIKKKPYLSILCGSLVVLTKEIAIVAVIALFLVKLFKEKKKALIYVTPILIFLLLLIANKIHYGHFLFPISTSLINIDPIRNAVIILAILKSIFFDQFRWILTSVIILSLISKKSFKKDKKQIILALASSLILIGLIFSLRFLKLNIYFPNINNYLSLVEKISIFIAMLFFLLILHSKEFFKLYIKKDLYELYLPLLFLIGAHFIIIPYPQRYGLPAYPLLFLIFAFAISNLFKKYSYLFVIFIISLFIISFTGDRSLAGFALEDNLEYRDFIIVRQQAANFISENYPDATVLVAYPMSLDLQHEYGKYLTKKLDVITMDPYGGGLTNKNYTQFLYPETIPEQNINLSEIDLYYYSPQEYPNQKIYNLRDQLNLTLIKRFEVNNKVAEIYLVNK